MRTCKAYDDHTTITSNTASRREEHIPVLPGHELSRGQKKQVEIDVMFRFVRLDLCK